MKNLLVATLILFLFSCTKETVEYTIISGKVTETADNKFGIRGNSFYKEIEIDQDGSFLDTLYIEYDGMYDIGCSIYLEKGKHVSFEIDYTDADNAVFSGDLAQENNYLSESSKLRKEIFGDTKELYSLEEAEFLAKLQDADKKTNELLENATFSSKHFKEKELRNIKYGNELNCGRYEYYHSYLTENDEFKVSYGFPKKDKTIDLDNADDFDFSINYRTLVTESFQNVSNETFEKQIEELEEYSYYEMLGDISLELFKAKKSQNIKNHLARILNRYINLSNDKSEIIYNELISNVTDEMFKIELTEKYDNIKALVKGNPSPKFNNYENHKGGTTSLDDLKGKYVYIDVWATWCGPCVGEIPFLKEVEEKYRNKNIEFVSISIDDKKDYEKWKSFVIEKEMEGVQLYADNAWKSEFVQKYAISGIPRFILIDTDGNIVSADAPRPSSEKLFELFDELSL